MSCITLDECQGQFLWWTSGDETVGNNSFSLNSYFNSFLRLKLLQWLRHADSRPHIKEVNNDLTDWRSSPEGVINPHITLTLPVCPSLSPHPHSFTQTSPIFSSSSSLWFICSSSSSSSSSGWWWVISLYTPSTLGLFYMSANPPSINSNCWLIGM